jgi:ElaB protein
MDNDKTTNATGTVTPIGGTGNTPAGSSIADKVQPAADKAAASAHSAVDRLADKVPAATEKVHSTVEKLAEKVPAATDRLVTKAHDTVDLVQNKAGEVTERLGQKAADLNVAYQRLAETGRGYVRTSPGISVLVALAAGFAVSKLLSSRRH